MDFLNMFAWSDVLVILIIFISTVVGFKTGFVMTIYRFLSLILSFYVAIKLYPIVTKLLVNTPIYSSFKKLVFDNVNDKLINVKNITIDGASEKLGIPSIIGDWIKKDNSSITGSDPVNSISNAISGSLSEMVIKILSVFLVFILVFLILLAVRSLLKFIVKLPLIKQVDKTAGLLVGIVTGFLIAYLVCACIVVFGFSVSPGARDDVNKSYVAKYFVKNNYIVNTLGKK